MKEQDNGPICDPTEKILYSEPHSDDVGSFEDCLYQCGDGIKKGIGISVGGSVYVLPLRQWHKLAERYYGSLISKEIK